MSGLSGAEFVLLDKEGQIQSKTLPITDEDRRRLETLPQGRELESGHHVVLGGKTFLAHRVPSAGRAPATEPGSLVVLYHEDRWWTGIRQAAYPALIAGGIAAAVAVFLTTMLAQRFVRPIRQLDLQTATIAGGRFQPVAVPARDDEIRDLTRSINSMTERLGRYETEVRQNEQLRTLGRLGAGMAHQLRNSATGARMAIELHLRGCSPDSDRESLEVALRQLRLMESYLQRFLGLGRDRPIDRKQVDLERLVDDVFELVRPACLHGKIELTRRRSPNNSSYGAMPESLAELLVNLILNALEAARQNAEMPPKVVVEASGEKDRAVLRVLDTGVGPAVAVQQRLFEPFVTEKPGGTGLGLFVARRIAEAHQGRIGWDRREQMTCFTVELPIDHRG